MPKYLIDWGPNPPDPLGRFAPKSGYPPNLVTFGRADNICKPSQKKNQREDFTVTERISGLLKKRGTLVLSLAKPLLISNDVRLFSSWIPVVYLGKNP